jgi:hypothetical protein
MRQAYQEIIRLTIHLPEANIDGLEFNEQVVKGEFFKRNDGWWESMDILFISARNPQDDNSRDLLTEYLNREPVRYAFRSAIFDAREIYRESKFPQIMERNIELALPPANSGAKKYHGIDCWYWLASPGAGDTTTFCIVTSDGGASNGYTSDAYGCSPCFRLP